MRITGIGEIRSSFVEQPMYKEFFGFSEEPFSLSPDPAFLFMAMSHWEALSSMMSGIKERKGLITITGDVGTGKTTLIYTLLKDLSDKIRTAFIFNPRLTFKQLMKAILWGLKVPVEGSSTYTLLHKFDSYLQERLAGDETVVIIIDEAQNLSGRVLEDLDRLFQRETPALKLLQVLLVGQLELEANLDSEELRLFEQRISIHRRISPLSGEESRAYIDHRLKVVGSSSSKVFTPEAVDLICEFAKGIPRVINMICDQALMEGYSASTLKIDEKIVKGVIAEEEVAYEEEITGEEEIPAGEEDIGKKEVASEQEVAGEREVFSAQEILPEQAVTGEEEATAEEKVIAGQEVVVDPQAAAMAEVAGWEEAVRAADFPQPQEGGESRRSRFLDKRIGIPALVLVCLAIFAVFYWPESRRLPSKEELNPSPAPRRVDEREAKKVRVEEGWNLSTVARGSYGLVNPTFIDLLMEANPQITDMNVILARQFIKVPAIKDELLLVQGSDQTYEIHLGTFPDKEPVRTYQVEPVLKGKEIEVVPRKVSSRETWYRIFAGKFKTREEAVRTIQALKQKGLLPLFPGPPRKSKPGK